VKVGTPPSENAARYRQGATVTIRTTDGRDVTSTVYVPKGAGILGIDWADIDAKYRAPVLSPASRPPDRSQPEDPPLPQRRQRPGTDGALQPR
jgi:hypothetical protein